MAFQEMGVHGMIDAQVSPPGAFIWLSDCSWAPGILGVQFLLLVTGKKTWLFVEEENHSLRRFSQIWEGKHLNASHRATFTAGLF